MRRGRRYARLRAMSPTYGAVTLLLVDKPREDRFYVFCLASDTSLRRACCGSGRVGI